MRRATSLLALLLWSDARASFSASHARAAVPVARVRAASPHLQVVATSPDSWTAAELSAAPNPPATPEHDILLRAARGEAVERTPVWLMRQAGRYMSAFREYSNKYEFRMRSETPEIATELSLQPWRAFGVDGVIMFSDILTPLPAMGVEFDVVRGSGPVIPAPLRTAADVAALTPLDDPDAKLPFIRTILGDLRKETEGRSTLLGFVGAPFTLVAYSVEGSANRHCIHTKKMMVQAPEVLHAALVHYADTVAKYACHQIECGAQCVQFFESWAHHLGAGQFAEFARPYANMAMAYVKRQHPDVPLVYYANGGSPYLELQRDMDADVRPPACISPSPHTHTCRLPPRPDASGSCWPFSARPRTLPRIRTTLRTGDLARLVSGHGSRSRDSRPRSARPGQRRPHHPVWRR